LTDLKKERAIPAVHVEFDEDGSGERISQNENALLGGKSSRAVFIP
jgi:hypothetical protein